MNEKLLIEAGIRKAEKSVQGIHNKKSREKGKKTAFSEYIAKYLSSKVAKLPKLERMHSFYTELIEIEEKADDLKKALGHLKKSAKIAKKIARKSRSFNEAVARTASVLKKARNSLEKAEWLERELKEMPKIEFDAFTVVLAGYPNTGKTTLLNRLTKSKAKIASFPFTTKKIMIGYFDSGYKRIQIVDTPGLLDKIGRRNKVEKKAVSALNNLGNIVSFLVDPTKTSGFSLKEQKNLFEELKKTFSKSSFITVISKSDIAEKEEMEEAKKEFENSLIEGFGKNSLKQEIEKRAKKSKSGTV